MPDVRETSLLMEVTRFDAVLIWVASVTSLVDIWMAIQHVMVMSTTELA